MSDFRQTGQGWWLEEAGASRVYPCLEGKHTADVVMVGGRTHEIRITSAAAAQTRCRRGAKGSAESRAFFPSAARTPYRTRVGGAIDVSPTHLPIFGSRGRVHHGFGFTGNGVGPAFLGGEILARLALDRRDELTRLPLVDPPRRLMPPEPFRRAGGKYHPQRAAAERRGRGCRKNARHPRFLHRRIAAAIGPAFAALAERARELGNGRLRRLGRTVHARRVVAHSVECERVALDREAGRSQLVDA